MAWSSYHNSSVIALVTMGGVVELVTVGDLIKLVTIGVEAITSELLL